MTPSFITRFSATEEVRIAYNTSRRASPHDSRTYKVESFAQLRLLTLLLRFGDAPQFLVRIRQEPVRFR